MLKPSLIKQPMEVQSVGQQGVTIPSPQDDLGQIYITFDPTVKCYRFTNSKAPEDPIWEGFMFHAEDITSAHYCGCDFHLDTGDDIDIRMSHEAAAKAFVSSLARALNTAFVSSVQSRIKPVKVIQETV